MRATLMEYPDHMFSQPTLDRLVSWVELAPTRGDRKLFMIDDESGGHHGR